MRSPELTPMRATPWRSQTAWTVPVASRTVARRLLQPARQVLDLEPLEGADDGAFGLEEQLGDRRGGWEGLVAQRKVEQQIADGMDAQAGIQPRADGAHALEGLNARPEGDADGRRAHARRRRRRARREARGGRVCRFVVLLEPSAAVFGMARARVSSSELSRLEPCRARPIGVRLP